MSDQYLGELTKAAQSGSEVQALVALRDYLAEMMDGTKDVRSAAALAKQFRDTVQRIDELGGLKVAESSTPLDQLAARRKARGAS